MEMNEFLNRGQASESIPEELDVQRAVVESLAAEKVEQDERIAEMHNENERLKSEISELKGQIAEMKKSLEKVGDVLAVNSEGEMSSMVALLDRNVELKDRFAGETHDHVLEVVKEAREQAEKEGCIRKAQILESILCVNTPVGNLAKKREELRHFFAENGNILSGTVISELDKKGISYKHGEDYLLADEIIKRTY